jgi:hypothetical protein
VSLTPSKVPKREYWRKQRANGGGKEGGSPPEGEGDGAGAEEGSGGTWRIAKGVSLTLKLCCSGKERDELSSGAVN